MKTNAATIAHNTSTPMIASAKSVPLSPAVNSSPHELNTELLACKISNNVDTYEQKMLPGLIGGCSNSNGNGNGHVV